MTFKQVKLRTGFGAQHLLNWGFPGVSMVKHPPANTGDIKDTDLIPGSDDPLEENMTSHSNIYT